MKASLISSNLRSRFLDRIGPGGYDHKRWLLGKERLRRGYTGDTSPKNWTREMLVFPACEAVLLDPRRTDEEELHSRADAAYGAASGERNTGRRSLPQARDHRTNLLQVEAARGRHGDRGADPVAAVGRRKQETESISG